jgi:hypothetical protein
MRPVESCGPLHGAVDHDRHEMPARKQVGNKYPVTVTVTVERGGDISVRAGRRATSVMLGHACETLAVMYLQPGPLTAENKSTTHRTHSTALLRASAAPACIVLPKHMKGFGDSPDAFSNRDFDQVSFERSSAVS